MAGRCGGGAARNAGAAGRAMAGGAGRAIAGGEGRAIAAGGEGRAIAGGEAAPCGPRPGWADAPTLDAITDAPTRNVARRTPGGSMIAAP